MTMIKPKECDCFLIDKQYCEFTQKKIAVVMGMVANTKDLELRENILNELANIRAYFNRKELREYSDGLLTLIDVERFIDPSKPVACLVSESPPSPFLKNEVEDFNDSPF